MPQQVPTLVELDLELLQASLITIREWLAPVSFGAGPIYVALTQTASSLPFFVFALPAGSLGDLVDRRRLILVTEFWMAGAAILLAALTFAGAMTPWLLLCRHGRSLLGCDSTRGSPY